MSRNLDNYTPEKYEVSKQLTQSELTTTPTSYYSPNDNVETFIPIGGMVIVNASNAARWFSMWVDDNGTGVVIGNRVEFEKDIGSDATWVNNFEIRMNNSAGNLSFAAERNSVLTLTINGIERDIN